MNGSPIKISFVIPALNEEKHIGICIESIKGQAENNSYEIIVVDNGSTDNTQKIASSLGARLIVNSIATIGQLRNIGVTESSGNIIVFLDADIELSSIWWVEFNQVKTRILESLFVTGSHPTVPTPPTFIEKHWFDEFRKKDSITHLGSAHIVLSRKSFDLIQGFDESLESGEDYDFCVRAKMNNIELENNHNLSVIHHGFPKSIYQFIRRESWHGKGDFKSLHSSLNSKVVILSIVFLVLHLGFVAALIVSNFSLAGLSLSMILALLAFSSFIKYSHSSLFTRLVNTSIFYLYFTGRVFSIFRALTESSPKK